MFFDYNTVHIFKLLLALFSQNLLVPGYGVVSHKSTVNILF